MRPITGTGKMAKRSGKALKSARAGAALPRGRIARAGARQSLKRQRAGADLARTGDDLDRESIAKLRRDDWRDRCAADLIADCGRASMRRVGSGSASRSGSR